jgi:hypothetical protein
MAAWLKNYGHTLEPLCFPDTGGIEFAYSILDAVEALWPGSTRIARLIEQHDEWLKKKKTNDVSWYDLITHSMGEADEDGDGIIWDTEND